MKYPELRHAKRWTLTVLTAVLLGVGAFVTNTSAQNAGVFEIQVPFDFVVMGRTYEAARYRIGRLSQADPDTLVLNNSAGKTLLIIHTQRLASDAPAEFSRLVFSRYGSTNFLESVVASGASYESRIRAVRSDRRRFSLARVSQTVSLNVVK